MATIHGLMFTLGEQVRVARAATTHSPRACAYLNEVEMALVFVRNAPDQESFRGFLENLQSEVEVLGHSPVAAENVIAFPQRTAPGRN